MKKNNLGRPKGSTSWKETIGDLVPAFYSLAIASIAMNKIMFPMLKEEAIQDRKISRLLKRRGLVIVKIIDKDYENTYQELKGLKENLELFIKLNKGKWKLEKEESCKIKTGNYILRRIYRKYNKPVKETEVCKECGRSLEDYDD